jgi:hypothetical protein
METVPINFCETVGFNVVCNATKEAVLDDLRQRFGVSPLSRRTDVLSEKNKRRLDEAPAVMHLQSTGTAYVLFLTRVGFQQVALLIDRKVNSGFVYPKMISVHLLFKDDLFDGTIFTGELIKGFSEWMFLVDDLLAVSGKRISSHMFRERYAISHEVIKTKQRRFKSDMFALCMKRFFQVNRAEEMLEYAKYMPYKIKGVSVRSTGPNRRDIFLPVHVKTVAAKTVYLAATAFDDTFTVHEGQGEHFSSIGNAHIQSIEASHYLKSKFEGVPYGRRVPLVCEWNANFDRWQPVPAWL